MQRDHIAAPRHANGVLDALAQDGAGADGMRVIVHRASDEGASIVIMIGLDPTGGEALGTTSHQLEAIRVKLYPHIIEIRTPGRRHV